MFLWLFYYCKIFNLINVVYGFIMRCWYRFGSVIMNKYLIFLNIIYNIIGLDVLKKGVNKVMSVIVYFFMYYVIKFFLNRFILVYIF